MSDDTNTTSEAAEPPVEYLSPTDIVILNAARNILQEATNGLGLPHTWRGGIAYGKYNDASDAIFDALSATRNYLEQNLTDDQVHGAPKHASVPGPLRA
jgi:hypothetical protein